MSKEDKTLVPWITPSLVATLLNKEREKGSPLTKEEVLFIRDEAPCVIIELKHRLIMDESRGYTDINPEYAWEEWQEIRLELLKEE